jgi:hypothetical protein
MPGLIRLGIAASVVDFKRYPDRYVAGRRVPLILAEVNSGRCSNFYQT